MVYKINGPAGVGLPIVCSTEALAQQAVTEIKRIYPDLSQVWYEPCDLVESEDDLHRSIQAFLTLNRHQA